MAGSGLLNHVILSIVLDIAEETSTLETFENVLATTENKYWHKSL